MSLMTRFEYGAIRRGFILEEVSIRTSAVSGFIFVAFWRVVSIRTA